MLTPANFKNALEAMGFQASNTTYEKKYPTFGVSLKVDLDKRKLFYPEEIKGRERNDFYDESHKENLVVFECVNRLLIKGYRPEHIELEKEWHLGHDAKGGRADICVTAPDGKMLFIIECKTIDKEYQSEYRKTKADGGQLFSYWQQERSTQWLVLYASDYADGKVIYQTDSVDCHDDQNILLTAKKDSSIKLYQDAHTTEELFAVWDETYEKRFCGDILFRDDTVAYKIGVKPLRKGDLKDFAEKDGVVNQFEEILRHNNVSDKENAFNRLVALFICKLVDEMQKGDQDEVAFQYKIGTDTYETLQDRLQRLHKEGMKEFMREDIFYVPDSYAEDLLQQYTGQKRTRMIDELNKTLRHLKFYTNNDFTFKDVHNEELFYQNGKILVEVVQLFEKYRIIDSNDLQVLGDLFEQLLNKGFKQNEGQFFTPIPITRFIWDSLPLDNIISEENEIRYPKIIDYACGAGHFLTQGYEAVEDCRQRHDLPEDEYWTEKKLYGVEKDYRLARVSKISLFMHGAGKGNIIFGDGLDNYRDKDITPGTFDILVANPPYSVSAFKPHLKLKDNNFDILPKISNNGSEIETLFVERIAQLLKPKGIAAVILPSSILNKENESFVSARESILTNFQIRAIAQFGGKTFSATGTNTVILFLEKYNEPPKRIDLVSDSVSAILSSKNLTDWEDNDILANYLRKIGVDKDSYLLFVNRGQDYSAWKSSPYFSMYVSAFLSSAEYLTKAKQKSFLNSSEDEQTIWCNDHFYDFALKIESEKLTYFALCYRQTTLVINSPADNKGQETFLGYTWSNRKGQEGIQIKSEGGLLYNPKNRQDDNFLAHLIRRSFAEKTDELDEINDYYDWLYLKDMLDFSGTVFNKAIKINKSNYIPATYTNKYPITTINEVAPFVTEKTSLKNISPSSYITTDNMLKEKGGIVKYEGTPHLSTMTKYQKNDILISNIRPYLKKIWFANCNGGCSNDVLVFRSYDPNKLLPEFLFTILSQDSFFDFMMSTAKGIKMPRGDKATIENFNFPLPPIAIQQEIIEEIKKIDEQLNKNIDTIKKHDENIKSHFIEIFGDIYNTEYKFDTDKLGNVAKVGSSQRVFTTEFVDNGIPFYRGTEIGELANGDTPQSTYKISEDHYKELISNGTKPQIGDLLMPSICNRGQIWMVDTEEPFYYKDGRVLCISPNRKIFNPTYLQYYMKFKTEIEYKKLEAGATFSEFKIFILKDMDVMIPPINIQDQFAKFVKNLNEVRLEANKQKKLFIEEREQVMNNYFK